MKRIRFCSLFVLTTLIPIFLSGCLLRTATVSPRHFVLAPTIVDESSNSPISHLPVEIGSVNMPAYLLRDSIAVRTSPNEIEYIEDALWGERLDHSFRRALLADLSGSFFLAKIHATDWEGRNSVIEKAAYTDQPLGRRGEPGKGVRVVINVEQFDVDTNGCGKLVAQWKIVAPDSDGVLETGSTSLTRIGTPPRDNPEAIASNMSALTAEFSHGLAVSISGVVTAGTISDSK